MANVEKLAADLLEMKPADRLRVAAGLLDRGQTDTAEMILKTVVTDLQALRLFGKVVRAPQARSK